MKKLFTGLMLGLGVVLALAGFKILGRDGKAAAKAEQQRDDLIIDGSRKARARAEKFDKKANAHQANAVQASLLGQQVMDKVGTENESMADLLDSWRRPADGV